ncbi:MAG TPA: diguanylate cyclase [Desulfuromonadales bacterium]|nr:diguanylate cyclase [Desulfuromonadales bacterium]
MTATLPKKNRRETALDIAQLKAIGLGHIQRLSRKIWSDYNVHDPGITILELLCYALTDLAYRASFPIEDLLASATGNAAAMQKQFFSARRILPNRPLTMADYRKLLIDVPGVKNAWLRPVSERYYADTALGELRRNNPGGPEIREITLSGLYAVTLEYDSPSSEEQLNVRKCVEALLQANRNLCEDFVELAPVESELFNLCCKLELAADADTAAVKAQIFFQLQNYLAPPVHSYTLAEMRERKKSDASRYTSDEIFDGPALNCGFIDDNELARAELRSDIRLSDVISIIMDITGVKAVREILLHPDGLTTPLENTWQIPVTAGKKALLNRLNSRIVFYKRNMPVMADNAAVETQLKQLTDAAKARSDHAYPYDFEIPVGRFRNPQSYYSFQNHFPAIFGLSEAGLSSGADARRTAQALQLKAYLLFFDQLLANYLAQLGHIAELFSHDHGLTRSYFYQAVTSFSGYEKLYGTAEADKILTNIEAAAESSDALSDRRNRFLDHLIARFAERFNDFTGIMYSAFGSSTAQIISDKCAFLRDYPAISSERSLAYNYRLTQEADLWNSGNISGLERRLARLLGIRNPVRRNLGDIAFDVYAEIDGTPDDDFRFRIRNRTSGKILLSSSTRYTTQDQARAEMRRAIQAGLLPYGYQRKTTRDERYYFTIIDGSGEVLARRIEYFDDTAKLNAAIDETMEYLRINYSDEGMFLIENILLRPETDADPLLPICAAGNGSSCAESDPYSFRIHIILPAYGRRFQSMDFRRFAEGVIREETPAHILPKICWISRDDMAAFETAYREWIHLKAGVEKSRRQEKLSRFIEMLFTVRNCYPTEHLHECEAGDERPKFILGSTALGTTDGNNT